MNDKKYFTGEELYGDDFTIEQIEKWYNYEAEAYSELGSHDRSKYTYQYHNNNKINGFSYLKNKKIKNVLGIGSAYGDEFLPIVSQMDSLTILEPSDNLKSEKIGSITPTYKKPNIDGSIDFDSNTFDLITCFGVLHHIPNVTFVMNELIRVLAPGGFLLIKEPVSTMGDWNYPREGLTKCERGIPVDFFENILKNNNVIVRKKTFIDTLSVYKILRKIAPINRDSVAYVYFDRLVSRLLSWNMSYHRTKSYQKLAPGGVFYVIEKK